MEWTYSRTESGIWTSAYSSLFRLRYLMFSTRPFLWKKKFSSYYEDWPRWLRLDHAISCISTEFCSKSSHKCIPICLQNKGCSLTVSHWSCFAHSVGSPQQSLQRSSGFQWIPPDGTATALVSLQLLHLTPSPNLKLSQKPRSTWLEILIRDRD